MVRRTLGLLVLASALVTHPVAAQRRPAAADASSREARTIYEAGVARSSEERWAEALELFQRSRALVERPSTVFNIAAVLVRLGRAQEALQTLDAFERIANPSADATLLTQAQTLRASATASLRHIVIEVSPADAQLSINGQLQSETGASRSLTLDPGEHTAELQRDGYETTRLVLESGQSAFTVALAPLEASLRITSTAEATSVRIDAQDRGSAPLEVQLAPGEHHVALQAAGYLPFERTLTLQPAEAFTLDAQLELIPPLPLEQDPLFWVAIGASVVGAGLIVGLSIVGYDNRPTDPVYRGTSGVALAPLRF
jgi:tetratricopeptide (TPR) repeat protein